MNKRFVYIKSFIKGMTDSVENDYQFESEKPFDNHLWIENFNTNNIIHSITLRNGITYSNEGTLIGLDANEYSEAVVLDAFNNKAYNKYYGAICVNTNRPYDHNMILIFTNKLIDGYEGTSIIARTLNEDLRAIWHEPYILDNEPETVKLYGEFRDAFNYANNIFIVTEKSQEHIENNLYLYPVYIYRYEDYSDYRYVFLPYDYKPLSRSMWKLRKPSKYLIDKDVAQDRNISVLNPYLLNPFDMDIGYEAIYKRYFGHSIDYFLVVKWSDWSSWQGTGGQEIRSTVPDDLRNLETDHNKQDIKYEMNNERLSRNEKINVIFWQTDIPPYGSKADGPYIKLFCNHHDLDTKRDYRKNFKDDYIVTIEDLATSNDDWRPYQKVLPYGYNTVDSCHIKLPNSENYAMVSIGPMDRIGHPYTISTKRLNINDTAIALLNGYVKVKSRPYDIIYKNTKEELTINCLINHGLHGRFIGITDELVSIYNKSNDVFIDVLNEDSRVLTYIRSNDSTEWGQASRLQLPIFIAPTLYNYTKNNLPRTWMTGDEIKYVLTAVIDGVEVEVKRGEYKVPESFYYPTISHFDLYFFERVIVSNSKDLYLYYNVPSNSLKCGNPNSIHHAFNGGSYASLIGNSKKSMQKSGLLTFNPIYMSDIDISSSGIEVDGNKKYHKYPIVQLYPTWHRLPYICFTLRLNYSDFQEALDDLPTGLTQFKLYICEADNSNGYILRDINGNRINTSNTGYSNHMVRSENSNNYRLVKTFTIRDTAGENVRYYDYERYRRHSQGSLGFTDSNRWKLHKPSLLDTNDGKGIDITRSFGTGIYAIPQIMNPEYDLNLRNKRGNNLIQWTPDFYLWDYPSASEPLIDNLSAAGKEQLWDGVGARLVTATRGATIIGGCQDNKGNEEIGKLRISLMQNGKPTLDIFTKWDFLQVGRERHTAICNFNDTIIVFSEEGFSRVILNDINNASTWYISNEVRGQGVRSQKHVVVTPYGVVFMNRNGVYMTDGVQLEELSIDIKNTYKRFVNSAELYSNIYNPEIRGFDIDSIELNYVSKHNELRLHANDMYGSEYVLIYSLYYKNWRVYRYATNMFVQPSIYRSVFNYGDLGESRIEVLRLYNLLNRRNLLWNNYLDIYNGRFPILNLGFLKHYDINSITKDRVLDNIDSLEVVYNKIDKKISGIIITNDIGDGISDYLLDKFIIECSPINVEMLNINAVYDESNPDPIIKLITRHSPSSNHYDYEYDIASNNFRNNWRKFLVRTSPTNLAPSVSSNFRVRSRESFIFNVPFGISFRRGLLYIRTGDIGLIREIVLELREMRRRVYS